MIYLFGDSWGFSYRQAGVQTVADDSDIQVFHGADLSSLMMQELDQRVVNLCDRGLSLHAIAERLTKSASMFKPGDIVFVLQTDPLRSKFIPWWNGPKDSIPEIMISKQSNMIDVCDILLRSFYTRLKTIERVFKVKVVLHGGIGGINHQLADEMGITHTMLSSSQVIIPDLPESYFFDADYVMSNHEVLQSKYDNYMGEVSELVEITKYKNHAWSCNPEFFTFNHTTEAGTRLVAKYLADFKRNLK